MRNETLSQSAPGTAATSEAKLEVADAKADLLLYRFEGPSEGRRRADGKFRIELGLTPWHRSARANFPACWTSARFEGVGKLFVIPPDFEVIFRTDEVRPLRSIALEFDAMRVYRLIEPLPSLSDWHLLTGLDLKSSRIRTLLLSVADEVRTPGFASSIVLEALSMQIAVELVRVGNSKSDARDHGGLAPWQLRRIDDRLADIAEAPALSELAQLCRISVRQLARGFLASRGTSVGGYVARNRMEQAKRLLAREGSVAHVASSLGFSSTSNFCVAFRRDNGLSPTQYRRIVLGHRL